MKTTATLKKTDETKNYVKYEYPESEDGEVADFTSIYIPQERFDDAEDAPEETTLTLE